MEEQKDESILKKKMGIWDATKVLLIIFFFPFAIIWYVWVKTKWSKKNKIISTITTLIMTSFLLGIYNDQPANQSVVQSKAIVATQKDNIKNKEEATSEDLGKTKEEGDTKSEKIEEKPQSTVDKLWIALDESMKTREGYEIEYIDKHNEETEDIVGTVIVTKTGGTYWDDNDTVREAYSLLVKYGKRVIPMDEIFVLKVQVKGDFTDSYGKKSIENVVIISITEYNFNKFEWDNLKFTPVSKQIEMASSEYYIHPSVKKNLKEDKLYLVL